MLETDVIALFRTCGAIKENGHVAISNEEHSAVSIDVAAAFAFVETARALSECIALQFLNFQIEAIVGLSPVGIVLSQRVADYLRTFTTRAPLALFAEKSGENDFILNRQYGGMVFGKRVLVVEDVIASGESVRKVITAVRDCGGNVIGVGTLWNRGDVTEETFQGVERFSALVSKKFETETWDRAVCPLCIENKIPIDETLGHGAKPREKLLWDL